VCARGVAPFGGGLETSGAIAEVREKFADGGFRKSRAMKSQTGEPDIMPPRVGAKQVARGTLVRPASANSGERRQRGAENFSRPHSHFRYHGVLS
jgi:hypothetical protein